MNGLIFSLIHSLPFLIALSKTHTYTRTREKKNKKQKEGAQCMLYFAERTRGRKGLESSPSPPFPCSALSTPTPF